MQKKAGSSPGDQYQCGSPAQLTLEETQAPCATEFPCPILEITKQDFFQEAKSLIAQHYERINENKFQGTSVNVFKNKHQKPKSGKFIPLDIKIKETPDVVQKLQAACKSICFPKDLSKSEHFEELPQQTFKEPHIFHMKEKCKDSIDLIVKVAVPFSVDPHSHPVDDARECQQVTQPWLPGRQEVKFFSIATAFTFLSDKSHKD
ncbi:IQ domain-containing protein M-like [Manis pentadactyla]|uniref:IQ domain-containing protein M-like n=1 Tax=Manis pentadactyla TaxID=143292 RepID=UPI00255C5AEB|nr:IQ domain-containing protein M-like [Manis pentadactyla]